MTAARPTPGVVVWITGLPGVGKTTVGRALCARLRAGGAGAVVHLDGDAFREMTGGDLGYGTADRLLNARRISRVCRFLAGEGVHVVCSTVSLFHEVHRWNRAEIPRYVEVLLTASPETLCRRDPKGLYASALASSAPHVVGVDQPPEEPEEPDLVLETDDGSSPEETAARIDAIIEARAR